MFEKVWEMIHSKGGPWLKPGFLNQHDPTSKTQKRKYCDRS